MLSSPWAMAIARAKETCPWSGACAHTVIFHGGPVTTTSSAEDLETGVDETLEPLSRASLPTSSVAHELSPGEAEPDVIGIHPQQRR
jgi:hypothetical protein